MSTPDKTKYASWAYAEEHAAQNDLVDLARVLANDLGTPAISEGTAAALTVLAAAGGSRAIVGIGLGTGLAAASLMHGASAGAVLTGIDADPDRVAATRQMLQAQGVAPSRTRLITGKAEQVLPRLTSGGYDLVFIETDPEQAAEHIDQGLRLLHPGGMLILNDALDSDRVPKPAVRQPSTQAMRQVESRLREDDAVVTAMIPTGTGLLTAVRR
ncbi:O-methyltransferase [Nesterenkonia muleiensis]|uniref:O-methyltransferase n=1 Tax=Nesterenkonia muleiensis TaxID=2282648 RepID=UPI000E7586C5|nr:class I SAM-dependent methyltransferase [Nesterenkonia muleiensis]